jgi:hypothetical protein
VTTGDAGTKRWRVEARGRDRPLKSACGSGADPFDVAAHRLVETLAPGSEFGIQRWGNGEDGDDVLAELTVSAHNADEAEDSARSLLGQVLASVCFTDYAVKWIDGDPVLRWRVTCTGRSSAAPSEPHALWEPGEVANAEYWADKLVPGSEFTVEKYGTTRAQGQSVASVRMVVRVRAVEKCEAEATARRLIEEAMPQVEFTGVTAEPIIDRWVEGGEAEPVCSFCGKTQAQVKTLIAGPGVYVCDECIAMMSEIIEGDAEPADE